MSDREQRLAGLVSAGMVPSGYAEKAMASLLQLHTELMEEKERRVDLYRRLSEKEKTIAELRGYVRMLEERLEKGTSDIRPSSGASSGARRPEGWKQW
jgi:hypothetical protein